MDQKLRSPIFQLEVIRMKRPYVFAIALLPTVLLITVLLTSAPTLAKANDESPADVAISQTVSSGNIVPNNLTYTVQIYNAGPMTATNIVVTNTLFVGQIPQEDNCEGNPNNGFTCYFTMTELSPSASITFELVVTPLHAGGYKNTAVLASDNDPNLDNNTSIVLTQADNPIAHIKSITPTSVFANTQGFELVVDGTNFATDAYWSRVYWGSTQLNTTYISSTRLTAGVPAEMLVQTGTVAVSVFNLPPGGGWSNVATFEVIPLNHYVFLPLVIR